MSIEDVARVMGVPLPLVGDPTAGGVNNTETLVNFWLATGLGSLIENIESSLERAFGFARERGVEFDVDALLRTDMKTRIEALAKGVQGGIFMPDEARARESLPPVDGGDQVLHATPNDPGRLAVGSSPLSRLAQGENPSPSDRQPSNARRS